ncbi:hypothetical protein ANCCAN_15929 [Ancylostoma caninum]|uniref:Uncharacterized protein n=1 Tax=Ancylostoma caninum TaxID=29170 RepID=A0A368G4E9_ANCCA|nr:hypothetical protein ANCCAN_15929 [Ancylostoma caninum]
MTSACLFQLSKSARNQLFYIARVSYSSRGGSSLVASSCRPLVPHRCFSDKESKTTKLAETKEQEQTGLQRSILEEVLIKEKQKPTTFTGKVAEKASNTFLYAAVAAAVGMLGVFVYLLAGEFFAEDSPQKIYSSALALVREDGRCQDLFGPKIAGFGEETSRGRRRHVAHHKYEKDGRQRIRVLFHLKMEDDGFKVVTNRKRKQRLKKCGVEPAQRIEGSLEDIRLAIEKATKSVWNSGLSSWIISKIKSILGSRRISQVYVIGNGHFDAPWEPGTHQLALIREICSEFRADMVFQEPCLSGAERAWLSEQERIVDRDATDVLLESPESSGDSVQLVVLIHGLHGLLNDFLISNWRSRLRNVILICNDYRDIDFVRGTDESKSQFDAIDVYRKFATFVDIPEYAPNPSFFLNSSIVYIDKDVDVLVIRKKMKSLLADLKLLQVATPAAQVGAKRFFPASGTKPLPRYLWDMEDLQKKTGGEYTHEPLRINKLGGRHPETGRKVNQHIGGGVKFDYFMIDYHRRGPTEAGQTYDERVLEVRRDPNRTSLIALVAGKEGKRWILATENMKAGDIISTSCHIPANPVIGVEGNAYPVGALVAGTLINSVERFPDVRNNLDSDVFVVKAGTAATIVRHQGDFTVIRLPHKHEFSLHRTCMATVGRLSHADIENKIYGSAQMHRRFGYKMASGLFHKKDGYFGRKIRPLPPVRVLDKPTSDPPPKCQYSLTKDQLSGLFGHAKVHNLLPSGYSTRDYDYYKTE